MQKKKQQLEHRNRKRHLLRRILPRLFPHRTGGGRRAAAQAGKKSRRRLSSMRSKTSNDASTNPADDDSVDGVDDGIGSVSTNTTVSMATSSQYGEVSCCSLSLATVKTTNNRQERRKQQQQRGLCCRHQSNAIPRNRCAQQHEQ